MIISMVDSMDRHLRRPVILIISLDRLAYLPTLKDFLSFEARRNLKQASAGPEPIRPLFLTS